MINWLANRVAARIKRLDNERHEAELAALIKEREAGRREVRALLGEMEDMLEKFARVAAREGMRRTRAVRAQLEESQLEQQPPEQAAPAAPMSARERKALLRRNLRGGAFRRAGGDDE